MTRPDFQVMPALDGDDYQALKADVADRGILVAVEIDEHGTIIDGHHRVRAWEELRAEGVRLPDFPRVVRAGLSQGEKRQLARALNIARRHLNRADRRGLVADAIRDDPKASDRRIAVALGVSHPTVAAVRAELVAAGDVENLSTRSDTLGRSQPATRPKPPPSLFVTNRRDAERAGKALTALPPDARAPSSLLRAEEKAREAAYQARKAAGADVPARVEGSTYELRVGDLREVWADVPDGSIDGVLTDPPYTEEFIPLFEDLARLAARVLKPGRLAAVYCGHVHFDEEIRLLAAGGLTYCWHGVIVLPGLHSNIRTRMINGHHRSVLLFSAGPFRPRKWLHDLFAAEGRGGPGSRPLHPWQQAVEPCRHWVRQVSEPGETVFDPFVGSGTTAVAALAEGRRFMGGDVEGGNVATTRERLEAGEASGDEEPAS
jgi:ParB-like chromosome segregation protein Spo0J